MSGPIRSSGHTPIYFTHPTHLPILFIYLMIDLVLMTDTVIVTVTVIGYFGVVIAIVS